MVEASAIQEEVVVPVDARVEQLLDVLLNSPITPQEACRSCPELLPLVQERWRQMCRVRADLDALFPSPGAGTVAPDEGAPLPQVAGYEVEGVLGHGGMGVVFRARHLSLNRVVALKMVLAGAYAGLHERERFQREAEAVAALRHPNVVQIYDVGTSDGRPFFTMEYAEGGSLARKLAGAIQPPRQAAALLAVLAGGVHAAHRGGIVHRDLKPSNVLLTAPPAAEGLSADGEPSWGTPKISDFGLARRRDDGAGLTRTGAALGTPSYMAPEQAAGTRHAAEPAVDIYALGAVLYELLTGRPPFRAGTAAETVQQVLTRDPVPPSRLNATVPRDLEIICLKCLRKEPALRYATASALGEDLGRFLRGEAIAARPEGRLERLARRVRRRPVRSGAFVLGTLLTFGFTSGGLWLLSERAATLRRTGAEHAAAEGAADENLREMVAAMKTASWTAARAALERAKAWLGTRGSNDVTDRVRQGGRDLDLAARLDAIRLTSYGSGGPALKLEQADEEYEAAFRGDGFGRIGDPVEGVAARVTASHVRNALLAALDNWSICTQDPNRRRWVADVTARADGDPTGWRARARDPMIWRDEAALLELIATAPVPEQSVGLLLAVERVGSSDIQTRLTFLKRVHDAHPADFWVNLRLAIVLANHDKPVEAVGYYQVAVALRPGVALLHHNLGMALVSAGRWDEAAAQLGRAVRLDPARGDARVNLANVLLAIGRPAEALEQARAGVRLGENVRLAHTILGKSLEAAKRPAEALDHHRLAVAVDPKNREARRELRGLLLRLGRAEELCTVWAGEVDEDPPKHGTWYGYAELCLFVGREDDYLRARRSLLAKFGATVDPFLAERTSRACLLRPATGDELKQSAALADRAASADRSKHPGVYHAFLFVKGLAEYRQGRYGPAISTMEGDASRALGPVPRLVVAMAQHRSGRGAEARKSLAAAVSTYDWRADQVRDQDGWIAHVFRREAEGQIVPDLPALLDGTRRPRDNDERLAMLGGYLFAGRFHDAVRLYAEAFAADPNLVRDLVSAHRFNAARFAAVAAGGRGMTGEAVDVPGRVQLRAQARQWLRGELTSCRSALELDPNGHRERVRVVLDRCRESPDLAGLREPNELEKLPLEERAEFVALWKEFGDTAKRVDVVK